MRRSLIYILAALIALLLAGAAGTYYYTTRYLPEREAQLTMISVKNSKPAIQALYAGQYDSAIGSLRTLIKQAPTHNDRARLQELLMAALFDTGGNNTAEAASLGYGIVNDYSVSPWIRAMAFNTISRVVYAHDLAFYQRYFPKAPFSDYINVQGTDTARVRAAYLKILQVSDETYPTSFAEYGIAGFYFMQLIENAPIQQTPQQLATLMQKYVAEGDAHNDATLYPPYTIILDQLTRARAVALSNKILQNHTPEESEQAYLRVKATADTVQSSGVDMTNPKIQAVMLTWRFLYADFLLTVVGTSRTKDIQTLLASFAAVTSPDVIGFLERGGLGDIGHLSPENVTVVKAKKLAAISPEFKAFLVRLGVSF